MPDSSSETIPHNWEVMLEGGANNTAFQGFLPTTTVPTQGPLTQTGSAAPQIFIIKKTTKPLLQLAFMALTANTLEFFVRVSGISRLGQAGKFVASPILQLTCTAATGPLLIPDTTIPPVGELYTGVGTIVQTGGPDTVTLNTGVGELATVTFDPYGHEFIMIDWDEQNSQTMNGMYRPL